MGRGVIMANTKQKIQRHFTKEQMGEMARDLASADVAACERVATLIHEPKPFLKWEPGYEDLSSEMLQFLLSWWQGLRVDEKLPHIDVIDPFALKPALGSMLLVDVLNEGEDFFYRLYGTEIATRAGWDLTGKKLSEIDTPYNSFFMMTYQAAVIGKKPLYTKHLTPLGPQHMAWKWDRLILPFSRHDSVERLLVGIAATA
jgi:hypothetical protein